MKTKNPADLSPCQDRTWLVYAPAVSLLVAALIGIAGCGTSSKPESKKNDFFTSGSREADQRASQRMAHDEQLTGSGEGAGEKGPKKAGAAKSNGDGSGGDGGGTNGADQVEGKRALFDGLGGEAGIKAIVEDFTPRALQDPRVNWQRKEIKGRFSFGKIKEGIWIASEENVAYLKKHLVQFLILATGGPVHYDGKEMRTAHAGMRITNPEFDAALGDLKASLDRLKIPHKEQKELLSVIEGTRPQIVTER